MYVALARKYRPRRFSDLVGQEHVARALRGAVEQRRVAHGYLFAGPRGVGKTTAARILAMALNCETRAAAKRVPGKPELEFPRRPGEPLSGEPCGECQSCQRIWSGAASLDVVEIDAASNRGVDDARELRERAMYVPSQAGHFKVYIVDEAHMLTREAWNTLLKVLEEPPPGVVFVFATTEPHKITAAAAPVMSRLQRFDFRRLGPGAIAERLAAVAAAERLAADPDAIELIARVANGALRDALSVLDQVSAFGDGPVTAARLRELLGLVGDEVYAELLSLVLEHRSQDVFPFVAKLVEAGVDLVALAEGAGDLWRAALAVRLGAKPDGISAALGAEVARVVGDLAPGDLLRILRALEDAEEPIRRGAAPRLALETLIARWTLMDRTVDLAELLAGEGRPQGGLVSGTEGGTDAATHRRTDAPVSEPTPRRPDAQASEQTSRGQGPVTVEALCEAWPDIVAAARAERKMLAAEALQDAAPERLDGSLVTLRPLGGNALTADGLARNRATIEAILSRTMGAPLRVAQPVPSAGPLGSSPGPQRVSASGAQAERIRSFRGRDPALDSAMDALDLELLE